MMVGTRRVVPELLLLLLLLMLLLPLMNSFLASSRCHASVAHNKHSVLPVPVGDSNKAFSERNKASSTVSM